MRENKRIKKNEREIERGKEENIREIWERIIKNRTRSERVSE